MHPYYSYGEKYGRRFVAQHILDPFSLQTRAWILNIGFSLTFGAMFIKTWRIYKICLNKRRKVRVITSLIVQKDRFPAAEVFFFFPFAGLTIAGKRPLPWVETGRRCSKHMPYDMSADCKDSVAK